MTFETLAGVLGGLGLFFGGMLLLSESLKMLTSIRLRILAASWAGSPFTALGWGAFAGFITQSMTSLTFLTVGMRQSGLITPRGALSILLGGNIGTSILVLIVLLDIKLVALHILAITGFAMASGWLSRYRHHTTALFGAAMLIFGLIMMRESAAPLANEVWFSEVLDWMSVSLWFSFLGAIVLAFILQSVMAIIVMAIGLTTAGVLTVDQLLMMAFGSWTGSSLILMTLSASLSRVARQVAMYQVLMNTISCLVFMSMLFIENYFNVPLWKAAVAALDTDVSKQMGIYIILTNVIPALLLFLALNPTVRLCERLWPATRLDRMSASQYIHDGALDDFPTGIRLADLEQRRVISMFSGYLDTVRQGQEEKTNELQRAARAVIGQIDDFLGELERRHTTGWTESFNSIICRQKVVTWLEEEFGALCATLNSLSNEPVSAAVKSNFVEGIDGTMLVLSHDLASPERDLHSYTMRIAGDRGELMSRIRDNYLRPSTDISERERWNILNITYNVEQIFFLLSKYTREVEDAPAFPASKQPYGRAKSAALPPEPGLRPVADEGDHD